MPRRWTTKRKTVLGLVAATIGMMALVLASPWPATTFPADYSTVVTGSRGELLRVFLNEREQWHLPPQPDQTVPVPLLQCVVHFEDRRFFGHPGIDPLAVMRAAGQNLRAGRTISGASTLTMQVARLLHPRPRTLVTKLLEAVQALRLELRYTKEEILRLYLDHAPYGGNIVGAQAAAWRYFGHPPEQLTWGQAATLAVLPNAPGLISPQADAARLRQRRDALLRSLHASGVIDAATSAMAQAEDVPVRVRAFPLRAPHLTQRLASGGGGWIRTTLDGPTQERAESLVRRHARRLQRQGIRHAAVVVAETPGGEVRAYVGAPDFFDARNAGQVDGVRAPRSSGSLLKPLLYALAQDEGLLLAPTQLEDIPTFFGAFAPRNADRDYRGLVPARDALVQSLNVPAVRLLDAYGVPAFHTVLQRAGLTTLFRAPADYGLPLIIGGAEVTLWDMAMLFRGLGRHGTFAPLQVLAGHEPERPELQLISPGASQLTLDMLREVERPGAEFYWRQYQDPRPLAWKTGTSYGRRDAWAVGVSPQWTVAVWAGNFSGEASADLSGASSAGPLLFDLVNSLPEGAGNRWFQAPEGSLKYVRLCPVSGMTAGPHCAAPIRARAPASSRTLPLCGYHRVVHLSVDGDERVCSLCWSAGERRAVSWAFYPSSAARLLRARGQQIPVLPPHRAGCPGEVSDAPVEIIYPQPGAQVWLPRDLDGAWQKLVLQAVHRDPGQRLHWYVDDRYLGSTRHEHTRAVAMDPGWRRLHVLDSTGQRATVRFHVSRR